MTWSSCDAVPVAVAEPTRRLPDVSILTLSRELVSKIIFPDLEPILEPKIEEKKGEETEETETLPKKKTRKTKTEKPAKKEKPPKPPKMEKEYLPMKKNMVLDKDKLIQGEYSLEELVEWTDPILGIHEGESMILKSGKFGSYVEWGDKRESIAPLIEKRKKQG